MINLDHRRYFIPESGPVLEQAKVYRNAYNIAHKILWDYTQTIGGLSYALGLDGGVAHVKFKGPAPFGWKTDKDGLSRPRFRSEAAKALAGLPKMPRVQDYLTDMNILLDVKFKVTPDAPESCVPIGNPQLPPAFIDWYDKEGPLMIAIPDQSLTCAALIRRHPEIVFVNNEHQHDPNTEGCREILLKEWELAEEKHKRGMAQ